MATGQRRTVSRSVCRVRVTLMLYSQFVLLLLLLLLQRRVIDLIGDGR